MKNVFALDKNLWCEIRKTPYCPNIHCDKFWGCETVEAERKAKLKKIEEEVKKRKDFNEMCRVNYDKMIQILIKDPLIKRVVKKSNKKEVKTMKYSETKVVKVKKEKNKCEHPHPPAMVILKEEYAQFKCLRCGEIYGTNILSNLWEEQPKGNYVNGENLDKIKFPCFCSYSNNDERGIGFFQRIMVIIISLI